MIPAYMGMAKKKGGLSRVMVYVLMAYTLMVHPRPTSEQSSLSFSLSDIVMARHSYGSIYLWPYIVMALYSYGPV